MSKILRDHKKLNLPLFPNNLLEDLSISEYFKIVLIMMVKKNLMLRSTTPLFVLIMCLIISSHFTSEHRAEITSCQHHLRQWNFLVLSMNTGIPPVRSSSALDTNKHTQAQAQGQAKAHTPLLLPNFFFCLSCSLSALFLFCDHAVQKKKLNYFKCSPEFRYAYCNFLTEQQWTRTSVDYHFVFFLL